MKQIFLRGMIVAAVAFSQVAALNPQWGAVLPDDQALTFARPRLCNRPGAGPADGTWAPDAATIRRLESVLGVELQAALDLSPERGGRARLAGDYYRQYAPLVIGGKRIVYINGFHRRTVDNNPKFSWKTTASQACDGGQLFFGTEYDVAGGRLSRIIFNGGGRGASPAERAGSLPSDLTSLMTKAAIQGRVYAWCKAGDRYAVATVGAAERGYIVLATDGPAERLSSYEGRPDLTCYTHTEAEKLDATVRSSETIEGSLTPRWDSTVVCGFIRDTEAVCWQYSPQEKKFVRVGGWTT